MKQKTITILIILFFLGLLVIFLIAHKKAPLPADPIVISSEYTITKVRKNDSSTHCLMANSGVVYDLSGFLQNNQFEATKLCGKIDPDLAAINLKIDKILSYKIGILVP